MKRWRPLIILLLLTGCVEQIKQRVESLLGEDAPVKDPTAPEEYKPTPPPVMEQDKIIQVSPKERLFSLLEQFNRTPDSTLMTMVIKEFTVNKAIFSTTIDPALYSALNRTVPNVQQGDISTLQLLTQLLPLLNGENKEHLFGILARGFDSAPALLADLMGRRTEDKLCNLVNIVPPEVTIEEKRNFLESRLAGITAAKDGVGNNAAAFAYLEACQKTLQLTLAPALSEPQPALEPAAAQTPPPPADSGTPAAEPSAVTPAPQPTTP